LWESAQLRGLQPLMEACRVRPMDAMEEAVAASMLLSAERKPGALIERLRSEVREGLQSLTSDELGKMRVEFKPVHRSKRWKR
jgi:hypothetical protein